MKYRDLERLTYRQLQNYTYRQLEKVYEKVKTKRSNICRIEFFTKDFVFLSSAQTSDLDFEIDYLDIVKNKIEIPNIIADIGGYVVVKSDFISMCGVVVGVEKEKNITKVSYKDIVDIFDVDIPIDTKLLKTTPVEEFIAYYTNQYYISNHDKLQNIIGLTTVVQTLTTNTVLSIEKPIDNFYKNVIYASFLQYGIVLTFSINAQDKKINCEIKKSNIDKAIIESSLSNIINKKIEVGVAKESTNKLIVFNEDDLTQSMVFYLHTDSSVSAIDEDRVLPVIFTTETVTVGEGEVFSDVALEKALATLKATEYNNLIEIEVKNDDDLVKPYDLKIGQKVSVIDNGNQYESVLTGKKIGKTTTLIFGAIRKELTKKLKWGY